MKLLWKLYFNFISKKKFDKEEKIQNIAVIKSGAIGDVLLTTPFIRVLRRNYPNTHITYIVGDKFIDVLKGNKNIDEIITFDTKKLFGSGFREKYSYFKELAKSLRGRFDTCFILDKSYLAGLFAYWAKIPIRIGFDRAGEGFANTMNIRYMPVKHETEYYLDLIWLIGGKYEPKEKKKMDLPITKREENFASRFIKENRVRKKDLVIGIAPAATKDPHESKSTRAWPARNYIELIKRLIDIYDAKVIFFGSRDDIEIIEKIQKNMNKKTYSSAGKTTIKQAAALIKRCRLFITHDCGLMHVAAAIDVPVISIFGPTDPRRKAPLNEASKYITKDTLRCETCEVYGKFPYCNKHAGTDLIEVSDVMEIVDEIIA